MRRFIAFLQVCAEYKRVVRKMFSYEGDLKGNELFSRGAITRTRVSRAHCASARCARETQEKYCAFAQESRACALRARDVSVPVRARARHARKK